MINREVDIIDDRRRLVKCIRHIVTSILVAVQISKQYTLVSVEKVNGAVSKVAIRHDQVIEVWVEVE